MALHRTVVGLLVAAATICSGTKTALAQVTQPQYVRPSKGAPLTLVPSVTASSVVGTFTTSALFDWSAFAGVIVTVNQAGQGTFSACKYGVRVQAQGSATTSSADFFLLNVANNDYQASTSQSWYIRVLPGYLRFVVGTYQAAEAGAPSCTYKVVATPLPFDYAGQLLSTGVRTLFAESAADDLIFDSTYPNVRLQNLDTSDARCAPVINGVADVMWRPAFVLKAASSSGAGDGGSIEITNWVGVIRCTGGQTIGFAH